MSLVMKEIFSYGIITPERLAVRSRMFKMTLNTCDKRDWYPIIRPNSFDSKLPGRVKVRKFQKHTYYLVFISSKNEKKSLSDSPFAL